MDDIYINEVRAFNRYYTDVIGVLNKKFLNGKYSLPELRVLQAIAVREGISASEITGQLNMDKSYLSRIILQFEKKKLITKKASPEDGRAYQLYLTPEGKKAFVLHDAASHNQVKQMLSQLNTGECDQLIGCMKQIKEILSGGGS